VSPPATVAETVEQAMAVVQPRDKRAALRALLRTQVVKNALLFCNRKRDVGVLHRSLERHGYNAAALHGDLEQWQRMETLDKFKAGDIRLLVCSDVAARGLDIPAVSHVFNFDVPTHSEDYVHRIGRTGRAGRKGHAFTLATPEDGKYIAGIEKLIGTRIPRVDIEDVAGAELGEETRKGRGGGRRKSSERAPAKSEGRKKDGRKRDGRSKDAGGKKESRRKRDRIGDVPDYGDTPFGETDLVPAFLKRSTG
jgi:superfamily II DNA/RNA helicase